MFEFLTAPMRRSLNWSRRDLFKSASLAGLPALFTGAASAVSAAPAATTGLQVGEDIYRSIGVRPLINCRGTFTIISGSLMLPEVRAAIDAAARQYVHLDELMDAIGVRLSQITKAESGMIASGCAAALTHATAACVAGGNPDLHVRIPDLSGFPKDEVIIPRHSRNVYDASVRAVGVRVIEVSTAEELDAAFGPRTAMVYILASPAADTGPLRTEAITAAARKRNVPVLVDAAAEVLTIPCIHLERGADLVGYSGGKCLRGPQSAGLLLGRKDLVKAAWVHSAPHHGFARALKVGKEDAIGMLMAVEMWVQRDHKAEWNRWVGWMNHIAGQAKTVAGVTTNLREPEELSNHSPSLNIRWDREQLGISGAEAAQQLLEGQPRIVVAMGRDSRDSTETGITIMAYMMTEGDDRIVGDRIREVLSKAPGASRKPKLSQAAADLSGTWDVTVRFASGSSQHRLDLVQKGNALSGIHQGDFVGRDLSGAVDGEKVEFVSAYGGGGNSLIYRFTGAMAPDAMSGSLDMGEYRGAEWKAVRRKGRGA